MTTTTIEATKQYNDLRAAAQTARHAVDTARAVLAGEPREVCAEVVNRAVDRTNAILAAREGAIVSTLAREGAHIPQMSTVSAPIRQYVDGSSVVVADKHLGMYPDDEGWRTELLLREVQEAAEQAWAELEAELEVAAAAAEAEFEACRRALTAAPPSPEAEPTVESVTGGDVQYHVLSLLDQRVDWLTVRADSLAESVCRHRYVQLAAAWRLERDIDGWVRMRWDGGGATPTEYAVPDAECEPLLAAIRKAYRERDARLAVEPVVTVTEI
jgi:hypothetical protein